jgi:hypothetical protein
MVRLRDVRHILAHLCGAFVFNILRAHYPRVLNDCERLVQQAKVALGVNFAFGLCFIFWGVLERGGGTVVYKKFGFLVAEQDEGSIVPALKLNFNWFLGKDGGIFVVDLNKFIEIHS